MMNRLRATRAYLYLPIALLSLSCTQSVVTAPTPAPALIVRFPISVPNVLVPSPDGRLLVGQDITAHTLTMFTRSGRVVGTYKSTPGTVPLFRWLEDSSGVFVWTELTGGSVPLQIFNADATIETSDLAAGNPSESSDGRLLAAERRNAAGAATRIEAAGRDGRLLRVVATGNQVRLLGWMQSAIIYVNGQAVYSVSLNNGSPLLITALPYGYEDLRQPSSGPSSSPDGTVLIASTAKEEYLQLIGKRLQGLPPSVVHTSDPVIWIGPRVVLSLTDSGELEVVDVSTGASQVRAHINPNASVQAVSGRLVAWTADQRVYITNLDTGKTVFAGQMPVAGLIYSLADGTFLLHGGGQSFIVRAA